MKLKLIVLIVIISTLIAGCVQAPKQEIPTAVVVPTLTQTPDQTPAPTTISTLETPAPKLKIMAVTVGQATIHQISITIKVKNTGDTVAKDVYAGLVRTWNTAPVAYENYPDKNIVLNQSIHEVLLNGSSKIDTGFHYNGFVNLKIYSDLINKDYIGDIPPGETKSALITQSVSEVYNTMIKVAWTDDKKEYAIY